MVLLVRAGHAPTTGGTVMTEPYDQDADNDDDDETPPRVLEGLRRLMARPSPFAPSPDEPLYSLTVHPNDITVYPLAITRARYGGHYEGGGWLAWCGYNSLYASAAYGSDIACSTFFTTGADRRIGHGDTIEAALADLVRRWEQDGSPLRYDWDEHLGRQQP